MLIFTYKILCMILGRTSNVFFRRKFCLKRLRHSALITNVLFYLDKLKITLKYFRSFQLGRYTIYVLIDNSLKLAICEKPLKQS